MEDREVEPELLSNLASVFRNISIKQAFNFAPRAERRMIVNRRAKKVARVFSRGAFSPIVRSFAIGCSLSGEYLFYAQDELSRPSPPLPQFSPTWPLRSTVFLLLFLFPSGGSRTSRLSLLHLFIGPLYYLQFGAHSREGNFILVFYPVAPRSPSRRFFASSGFPFFSFSSSSSSTVLLPF